MQKFFIKANQVYNSEIKIAGTDVNHIINVLRLRKKDKIQICNIDTSENYIAEIQEFNSDIVNCKIIEYINSKVESNIKVDLYQGLPKADKMEWIIQKTIEVGINSITPVTMMRSIVKFDKKDEIKKIERWKKISEVAAKQSKRDIIPKIENIIDVKQVLEKIKYYDLFLVAYEEENTKTLKEVLKKIKTKDNLKIGIFIGPEGGIDIKEIEMLKNSNVQIVSLGKRILRTETAPITMVANILYELE